MACHLWLPEITVLSDSSQTEVENS